MGRHGIERVLVRNQFYLENYRYLGVTVSLLLLVVFLLFGFLCYQQFTWPKPKYFGTTPDGRLIPVIRLTEPLHTDPNFVLQWAAQAVVAIYSLDFVTYRKTLQDAEVYFTTKGYQDFLVALKVSTNLEAVKAKKQVVSAVIPSSPVLIRQGQISSDRPYSWDLQMPITVTYENSEKDIIKQQGIISMRIERDSLLRHKEGIAIAQLILRTE